VFAKVRDRGANGNFCNGLEFGEIEDGEGAVVGGDVGVHVEIGAEKGGAMLVEDDDGGRDEEEKEREIEAWVFGVGHGMK
jgi:hypothetical protein